MASILIVILVVAAIVVMTIIASKSHHEEKGDVSQYIAKGSNEIEENGSSFLSYKDIPENPDWEKRRKWKQTLPK